MSRRRLDEVTSQISEIDQRVATLKRELGRLTRYKEEIVGTKFEKHMRETDEAIAKVKHDLAGLAEVQRVPLKRTRDGLLWPDGEPPVVPDKERARLVVATYTWLNTVLAGIARGELGSAVEGHDDNSIQNAREVWPRINAARVFDIDLTTYAELYHQADVYTTEVIAGSRWTPQGSGDLDDNEVIGHVEKITEAGKVLPFPERLPFDHSLFVYGQGVTLSETQLLSRAPPDNWDHIEDARLVAHLVSHDGEAYEFIAGTHPSNEAASIMYYPVRERGEWQHPYSLIPWVVTGVVDVVNSYRTFVHEVGRMTAKAHTRTALRNSPLRYSRRVPPPFYVVTLKHDLVRDHGRGMGKRGGGWTLRHRFDVRGHERIRMSRGPKPIPEKRRRELEKRGYTIFFGALDDRHAKLLAERFVRPKTPDEWMALKVCWVRPYTKGPEDAPYVPAVRQQPGRRK